MNQTLSAIQKLAKIEEFNKRMHELQSKTGNEQLFIALDARPRSRTNIVTALQLFTSVTFTPAEVWEMIEYHADWSMDFNMSRPDALTKLGNSGEARTLLTLYAEILGVPVVELEGGGEYINWTPDTFIDEITV